MISAKIVILTPFLDVVAKWPTLAHYIQCEPPQKCEGFMDPPVVMPYKKNLILMPTQANGNLWMTGSSYRWPEDDRKTLPWTDFGHGVVLVVQGQQCLKNISAHMDIKTTAIRSRNCSDLAQQSYSPNEHPQQPYSRTYIKRNAVSIQKSPPKKDA